MSSRTRKLAKQIELTEVRRGSGVHGCSHCRDTAQRQALVRAIVEEHGAKQGEMTCPNCSTKWRVTFSADRDGNALVHFDKVVLS